MLSAMRRVAAPARSRWTVLLFVSLGLCGCGKPAAAPDVTPVAITSDEGDGTAAGSGSQLEQATEALSEQSEPTIAGAATTPHTASSENGAARNPVAHAERLILFTSRGPLIVHLKIYIQGQPHREMAQRVLDAAIADVGGKVGEEIAWTELLANPLVAKGQLGNAPLTGSADPKKITGQYDSNRDGRVQRPELAAFLAGDNMGGRLFAVQWRDNSRDTHTQDSTLFALLDEDNDGRLSSGETSGAMALLRSRDADDDDAVVLADFRSPTNDPSMRRGQSFRHDLALELNKLEMESIFYTLSELYDEGSGLDAASLALVPGLLAQLDVDRNGVVSQQECVALVDARPDVLVNVNFASTPDQREPTVELVALGDDLMAAGARARPAVGRLSVELAGFELDLFAADPSPQNAEGAAAQSPSPEDARPRVVQQPSYRATQVQARVASADDPLFSWLDANDDGRLVLREMQGAAARLAQLDQNGDGTIAPSEIPDRMTCAIVRGARAEDLTPQGPSNAQRNSRDKVPPWLAAMDRNLDGEISPREFLGSPEQFAQWDANSDGFVDADEMSKQAETQP